MKKSLLSLAAVGLLIGPLAANAGMLGSTADVDFYYPDMSSPYCSNPVVVVGAGVEYGSSCSGFDPVSIDISDTQLTVGTGGSSWSGGSFNGFLLSILSGPAILSASYAGGTMNVTSLLVSGGNLWVNFAGQAGGTASINVVTEATRVPEPATLSLLGLGLVGFASARRKRLAD